MGVGPSSLEQRTVGEWVVRSSRIYASPFTDVRVDATFIGPTGESFSIPGFYDGEQTWRVRFNPDRAGRWTFRITSYPHNADLCAEGSFEVAPRKARGYLKATPGRAWGFHYESGEPVFLFGDTVYNLFGMAHCGIDVRSFLARRARQGFNLLRMRVPVSPFHPPDGYNTWQTRRTWPWGGSEQAPRFDRFNLDYFRTVDAVVREVEALDMGIEMIMEAWGFEFPFNSRNIFVPEWEELWLRYLIARYDAYNCVYFWTLMNEYEFYPNGDWHYKPVADRWAMRVGRWVKSVAQHGHVVSVHNGPREPAFAQRFAADPEAVDAIMFQDWGTRDERYGWLAAGIEDVIERALKGWGGSAVFAEWGYERNPRFPLLIPSHLYCDAEHTRRGAWRGAFCGLGIIHGFENSWGPFLLLEEDQPGMEYLLLVRRFFTEVAPFVQLRPAPDAIVRQEWGLGQRPLALSSSDGRLLAVYLPTGGEVTLEAAWRGRGLVANWYDPCTGALRPAQGMAGRFAASPVERNGHPQDWVLVLRA